MALHPNQFVGFSQVPLQHVRLEESTMQTWNFQRNFTLGHPGHYLEIRISLLGTTQDSANQIFNLFTRRLETAIHETVSRSDSSYNRISSTHFLRDLILTCIVDMDISMRLSPNEILRDFSVNVSRRDTFANVPPPPPSPPQFQAPILSVTRSGSANPFTVNPALLINRQVGDTLGYHIDTESNSFMPKISWIKEQKDSIMSEYIADKVSKKSESDIPSNLLEFLKENLKISTSLEMHDGQLEITTSLNIVIDGKETTIDSSTDSININD